MSPIKDFKLLYIAPNKENVFSSGDTVVGKVTFTLKEETKVKGVAVKVKGEARVHWTDGTGDRRKSHSDHRRYFKDKVVLVEEGKTGPLATAAGELRCLQGGRGDRSAQVNCSKGEGTSQPTLLLLCVCVRVRRSVSDGLMTLSLLLILFLNII